MELVDRPNSLEFDWRVSIQGYRLAQRLCRAVPGLFAAICCPITDCLELPSRCKRLASPRPGWTCPGRCAARSVALQSRIRKCSDGLGPGSAAQRPGQADSAPRGDDLERAGAANRLRRRQLLKIRRFAGDRPIEQNAVAAPRN